ncbi:MAG: hypothetical protein KDI50_12680, partial [Candidatus Competibacteraceae bacterium]|nr:hypothetical protein [Candidatus Competibacteraceae bacterium]
LSYLNPQLRFSAAIGWTVFAVILLAALAGANLAAREAERLARADAERLLTQFAVQIHHALDMNLEMRRSILQVTAVQIAASQDRDADALRHHLEAVQAHFPEFAWFGVADEHGRVVAATGGLLHGQNVSAQSWFQEGKQHSLIEDARHVSLFDGDALSDGLANRSSGFIVAVPIKQPSGHLAGVLSARLSWDWIERQQNALLRDLDARQPLDLFLITAADSFLLIGPKLWRNRTLTADADFSEGGAYMVGRNNAPPAEEDGLRWIVILRQDAGAALARAQTTRRGVFLVVFLAGLGAAVAAVLATRTLTRRLTLLADQAQAVRQGVQQNISVPVGADEIAHIGATLVDLVGHLQQEKKELAILNVELDARVAQRTARIERMAEEARHAAIARERLRLARELHDTLAHSLMALLTQTRLIRKLRDRLDPAELDAELAQVEEVATSGLAGARAAISQMRHNDVCDAGLGAALQDLLSRFEDRSGVDAKLDADTQAAGLADERAETVFRIVEEALNNVERHAGARMVRVTLRWVESQIAAPVCWDADKAACVRVEIVDDGVGFDPAAPCHGHYGLRGIREQAELIKARFELRSRPGQGTRIVLEFKACETS